MQWSTRERPQKLNRELREFNKQHIIIMMTKIYVVKNKTDSTMYVHSFEQTGTNLPAGNLPVI